VIGLSTPSSTSASRSWRHPAENAAIANVNSEVACATLRCIPAAPLNDTPSDVAKLHPVPRYFRGPPPAFRPESGHVGEICGDDRIVLGADRNAYDRTQFERDCRAWVIDWYEKSGTFVDDEEELRAGTSSNDRRRIGGLVSTLKSSRPRFGIVRDNPQQERVCWEGPASVVAGEHVVRRLSESVVENLHIEVGWGFEQDFWIASRWHQ
jgi:hypothetical protein